MNEKHMIAFEEHFDVPISKLVRMEKIMVFSSAVTDIRLITDVLTTLNLPYKVVIMSMGKLRNRDGFKQLQELTDWDFLPQIFIEGKFIGGISEFLQLNLKDTDVLSEMHNQAEIS